MVTTRQAGKGKRTEKRKPRIGKVKALKQINFNAAGLDIEAAEIWVAVPEERDPEPVRALETFTVDPCALIDWLAAVGVDR